MVIEPHSRDGTVMAERVPVGRMTSTGAVDADQASVNGSDEHVLR